MGRKMITIFFFTILVFTNAALKSNIKLPINGNIKNMRENEQRFDFEKSAEHILTAGEVRIEFGKLTEKDYKEVRKFIDKGILVLYEVKLPPDENGEEVVFEYTRKGSEEKGEKHGYIGDLSTTIHKLYYRDGECTWGEPVAEYVGGEWKEIK
jgi:hypothetical protein